MRVIEEEEIPSDLAKKISDPGKPIESEPVEVVVEEKTPEKPKRIRKSTNHSYGCLSFLSCFTVMILIVAFTAFLIVIFVAEPIVQKASALPVDFPKQIAIYQLDQAVIKVQTSAEKKQLSNLLSALPEWALTPALAYLTPDAKTQIIAGKQNPQATEANIDMTQLAQTVTKSIDEKTVSLSWSSLGKSKEEVFDYYKNKLVTGGFTVKENIGNSEIDLSFIGAGISGAMAIIDDFAKGSSSVVDLTVNYKSK
jgi:hypothetical protein